MTGKLIALVGYKGSGKTSLTQVALRAWNGPRDMHHMGFSDPMIDMLAAMGVPQDMLADKARWDDPCDVLAGRSIRYATLTLGIDWGRGKIDIDVWTNIALRRAETIRKAGKHVIIDNCRFPSEFTALRNAGAIMVGFYRSGLVPDLSHESEQHIKFLQRQCRSSFYNDCNFANATKNWREYLCKLIGQV